MTQRLAPERIRVPRWEESEAERLIALREDEGLEFREIGEVLGRSAQSCYLCYRRAKQRAAKGLTLIAKRYRKPKPVAAAKPKAQPIVPKLKKRLTRAEAAALRKAQTPGAIGSRKLLEAYQRYFDKYHGGRMAA